MQVIDLMTADVVTVDADVDVRTTARIMRMQEVSGLPVVREGRVVGVVSEKDILGLLETHGPHNELWLPSPFELIEVPIREIVNWVETRRTLLTDIGEKKVEEVMSREVISIGPDASIEEAAEKMVHKSVNRLPVIDDDKLVGIITRGDIIEGLGGL